MSANLCAQEHISTLVDYAQTYKGGHAGAYFKLLTAPAELAADGVTDAEYTFRVLVDANVASLAARYGDRYDTSATAEWKYRRNSGRGIRAWRPVEILKLISGFEYQACEYEGWETSAAAKWLEQLRHHAIAQLPGYDDAPWCL